VAAKNFRNGALIEAVPARKPIPETEILHSDNAELPTDPVHVSVRRRGRRGVVIVPSDIAHRYTSKLVYLRAIEVRTRRYGA